MYKPVIAGALIALGFLEPRSARLKSPPLQLQEGRMFVEYDASNDTAVLFLEAEAETALERVEVRDPFGNSMLVLRAQAGQDLAPQGFVVETRENSAARFFATYAEGIYELRARTVDGQAVLGSAVLSHALLSAPVVTHPQDGGHVPTTNLDVRWIPDSAAAGYRVVLEQDENDGLTVMLPPGTHSFEVPDGFLAPGTESHLEVAAIGANGNRTVAEVVFTTQ